MTETKLRDDICRFGRSYQAGTGEPFGDGLGRVVVWKQILDGREPRLCRRIEAVEEGPLVEHQGEVGGEAGHMGFLGVWSEGHR